MGLKGNGKVIAEKALNFRAYDQVGNPFELYERLKSNHIVLCFYPGGRIKPTCKKQFCSYRDNFALFEQFKVEIIGISPDKQSSLAEFARENSYPFTFLGDGNGKIATLYKCGSVFMLGKHSRAIFVIHQSGTILYRYVEPTILTSKGSTELLSILKELASLNLLLEKPAPDLVEDGNNLMPKGSAS